MKAKIWPTKSMKKCTNLTVKSSLTMKIQHFKLTGPEHMNLAQRMTKGLAQISMA